MKAFADATGSSWVSHRIPRPANKLRLGAISRLFARITRRLPRTEDDIADRYCGRSWGDETERHLLADVCNGRHGSFCS